MSAIFEREPGNKVESVSIERALEIRHVPLLFENDDPYDPGYVLADLFMTLRNNWMYSAAIQLVLNGSEPSWSRDGWSFVPFDMSSSSLQTAIDATHLSNSDGASPLHRALNISVHTPAIRGRLECSPHQGLEDLGRWLQKFDNVTSLSSEYLPVGEPDPSPPITAYRLGSSNSTSRGMMLLPDLAASPSSNTLANTSILLKPGTTFCCSNGTDESPRPVAVGYWSPADAQRSSFSYYTWPVNLTTKWIYGNAFVAANPIHLQDGILSSLVFPDPPSIQALNCKPVIETTFAWVTVDHLSQQVLEYTILADPFPEADAWSDSYFVRNVSTGAMVEPDLDIYYSLKNVTARSVALIFHFVTFSSDVLTTAQLWCSLPRQFAPSCQSS
jgi:hypothetical protein